MPWTARNHRDQHAHGQNEDERDGRDGKKVSEVPYRNARKGTQRNAKYEHGVTNFSLKFGTRNVQGVIADNVSCEVVVT